MQNERGNLWIPLAAIAGAGLLLWSNAKAEASSAAVVERRFDQDLTEYKKATENLAPALSSERISFAFEDGDMRERAFVMKWLASKAAGKTKYTVLTDNAPASNEQADAASKAAAKLAVDFRDLFYEKDSLLGERANKVLEAVKLESEGKKSRRDVSDALIALVADMSEISSASTLIDKSVDVLVNFTPSVTAIVNVSPDYLLEGYDEESPKPRSSYIGKIIDRKNTPYKGEYLIVNAPNAKPEV